MCEKEVKDECEKIAKEYRDAAHQLVKLKLELEFYNAMCRARRDVQLKFGNAIAKIYGDVQLKLAPLQLELWSKIAPIGPLSRERDF